MFLPDTCHQGTAAPPLSLVRKTKSNSGVPVMKPLERGFWPLMISLVFAGRGAGSGPEIQPCIPIARWTPGGRPALLVGGPAAGTLARRGGRAEAAGRWLVPTASPGLCGPCSSIAEERDTTGHEFHRFVLCLEFLSESIYG